MNKLKLALPVMLHDATEVQAFKQAKRRLENLLQSQGIPAEVGIFLYLIPAAIKDPDKRQAQIETQKRESFALYHAQTPIIGVHSLEFYGRDPAQALSQGCLLETATEHSARLLDYSPCAFDVDVHTGVFVYPDIAGRRQIGPGTYTLEAYAGEHDRILDHVRRGFDRLERMAAAQGLGLLLENEPLASYETGAIDGYRTPRLIYKPFGTPQALDSISRNRTFDTAHFASTTNVPDSFTKNHVDPTAFLNMLAIREDRQDDWSCYDLSFCNATDYLATAPRAIHLSNFEGIGVHLDDPETRRKWGKDGTNEGTLTPAEMAFYLRYARDHEIPVVLEVDFDIANIGRNQFIEADRFLNHVLQQQR